LERSLLFWVCIRRLRFVYPQKQRARKPATKHQIRRQRRCPRRAKQGGRGGRRMGQCPCFGSAKAAEQERRAEAERLESQDARAKAAEAAQRRQEEFDKSAAGRAAKAQMKAMKESKTSNQGEPVLKWQMGS
ncbi:unnamed protein product, partial [Urochloa humidicola]